MKRLLSLILSMCLVLAAVPALAIGGNNLGAIFSGLNKETVTISKEEYEQYQMFSDMLEMMENIEYGYYQELDEETKTLMLQYAAEAMLLALDDPYTFYYTPEDYAQLWEDDTGEYAGVGMQITNHFDTGLCIISRVFENTPAERAGIRRGDVLIRVNDLEVDSYTLNDAVDIMRGTPGTTVDITMQRNGEELLFTVERAIVNTNYCSAAMLDDRVGYIALYEFTSGCGEEMKTKLEKLISQGAKGIILDLRDNPGGWIDEADNVASLFVGAGVLCYLEDRNGSRQYYYTTAGSHDVELVILVNENSASSSEVVTGCLKDRTDCTVVGVTTFGKGIVQNVLDVGNDGAGMQMTVATYYTPNGNAVHHLGITPDVESVLPEGDNGEYDFADLANDVQLQAAYTVMIDKLN